MRTKLPDQMTATITKSVGVNPLVFAESSTLVKLPNELLPSIRPGDLSEILSVERVRGDGSGSTRKYGNTVVHGKHTFQSKKEAREYDRLVVRQKAGEIFDLEVHPVCPLRGYDGNIVYEYTADFSYVVKLSTGGHTLIVADVKSEATRKKDTWRLIRKLFRGTYGFDITEV